MSWNNRSSNKTINSSRAQTTWIIFRKRSAIQHYCNCSRIPNNLFSSNARFYWGIRKLIITTNTWSTRYSIPTTKQHKILITATSPNTTSFIRSSRKRSWNRMNSLPAISKKYCSCRPISRFSYLFPSLSWSFFNLRGCKLYHYCN